MAEAEEMNDSKTAFLQGEYSWYMMKRRRLGNMRIVCGIAKGKIRVGELVWHPAAKQIVFFSRTGETKPLLEFVLPMMDKKTFYRMWKK